MAFVYRSSKPDPYPSPPKKSPSLPLGNGRDILSQIEVSLFSKKFQQKKPTHKPTDHFLSPSPSSILIAPKHLADKNDTSFTHPSKKEREQPSSFFKSTTKRSILGELMVGGGEGGNNGLSLKEGCGGGTGSLHVNGQHIEGKEIQTQTYEEESTMVSCEKEKSGGAGVSVGEFEKILYNIDGDAGNNSSTMFPTQMAAAAFPVSKHTSTKNDLLKKNGKGADFSKSKVPRDVFKPKESYEPKEFDPTPETKPKPRPIKRQQKLTTASTTNTYIWGDESSSDSQQQYSPTATPGPGYYQPSYTTQFHSSKPTQIYKNKQPKYKTDRKENAYLGPTTYNAEYSSFHQKGSYMSRCQRFEGEKGKGYEAEIGLYNPRCGIESTMIRKILKDPVGNFGGNSVRFEGYGSKGREIPGPGEYNLRRQFEGSASKGQTISSLLNHNSVHGNPSDKHPGPGSYTFKSIFEPNRNEFQSLFKPNPPFGSSSHRFQTPPPGEQPELSADFQPHFPEKQAASPNKNGKPFNIGVGRFEKERRVEGPEVGEYYDREQEVKEWNKKSFNMLFEGRSV